MNNSFSGASLVAAMSSYEESGNDLDAMHLAAFAALERSSRSVVLQTLDRTRREALELFLLVHTLGTPITTSAWPTVERF